MRAGQVFLWYSHGILLYSLSLQELAELVALNILRVTDELFFYEFIHLILTFVLKLKAFSSCCIPWDRNQQLAAFIIGPEDLHSTVSNVWVFKLKYDVHRHIKNLLQQFFEEATHLHCIFHALKITELNNYWLVQVNPDNQQEFAILP